MQLDIFNIDDFITANKCPQISNPIFWNSDGTPTTNGLFSYELFGYSDDDRKNIFGYIDLHGHYLHPLIYLIMQTKMGALGQIVNGTRYGVIADKKIKLVDESFSGAETGIDFIYDHFDEINWINEIEEDDIDSLDKKTRLKFLKSLKKNEFFIDKWLVLPPFYRAESSVNRSMGDNINKLYKELISKTNSMSLGFSFDLFGVETKLRIQNILKNLYLSTLAPISGKNLMIENGMATLAGAGKNSMIRKHLLGKTVDWSASSVITSPLNSAASTPDKKPVPYGYGAFPIATLLSLFQPFYLNFCSDILEEITRDFLDSEQYRQKVKKFDRTQYSSDAIEKMIKQFIKNPEGRTDPINFEYINMQDKKDVMALYLYEYKNESDFEVGENYIYRPFTYLDLFYIASLSVLSDKHVYVTRFPIANFQNIYPSKIKILTTVKTKKVLISFDNEVYSKFEDYPTIDKNKFNSTLYDVMLCGNAYLGAIGGDYDSLLL